MEYCIIFASVIKTKTKIMDKNTEFHLNRSIELEINLINGNSLKNKHRNRLLLIQFVVVRFFL